MIKLLNKSITGAAAENALGFAHITVNKNSIVNDPQGPMITSGVRIGTPAITTRGLQVADCEQVAHWLCDGMEKATDQSALLDLRQAVVEFLLKFPCN